jgi:hypothetical protein
MMNRRPIDEAVRCWAATIPFLLHYTDRARILAEAQPPSVR